MTQRPALRMHAALTSSLRTEAVGRPLLRTAVPSKARPNAAGADHPSLTSDAWKLDAQGQGGRMRRVVGAALRPLLGVLPLLMVALWHASAMSQPPAPAPASATPQEAAVALELQVLQSQQATVSLRKLKTEQGTIELLLHPRTNRYYIAVTSRTGQLRRVVRADNERAAQLGFDSFRRLAGQGDAGRPALLGETLAEAGAEGAAQAQVPSQGQAPLPAQADARSVSAPKMQAPARTQLQAPALAPAQAPTPAPTPAPAPMQTLAATAAARAATPTTAAAVAPLAAPLQAGSPDTVTPTPALAEVPPPTPLRSPLMDELQRLQSAGQLTSMRRSDNGSFNAQLFFHVSTARYFVALAHGKDLWRVVQAQDSAQALRTYEELAGQSAALAGDELRRMELKAQTDAAERELRQAQAQARQMAEELEADRRYRAMIQAQESQSRADVSALQQQQRQIQEQLLAEQRRVSELRRQLDPGASNASNASAGAGGRKGAGAECRITRPGVPVPAAERDLPPCGPDGRARGQ